MKNDGSGSEETGNKSWESRKSKEKSVKGEYSN